MTNGRTPTDLDDDADEVDDAIVDAQAAVDNFEEPTADYTVAVTPRQLAGGFAILAALAVLLIRHRRGRKQA